MQVNSGALGHTPLTEQAAEDGLVWNSEKELSTGKETHVVMEQDESGFQGGGYDCHHHMPPIGQVR